MSPSPDGQVNAKTPPLHTMPLSLYAHLLGFENENVRHFEVWGLMWSTLAGRSFS